MLKELLPLISDSFAIHLAFPDYPGERPGLTGVHYVTFPLLPLLVGGHARETIEEGFFWAQVASRVGEHLKEAAKGEKR